MNDFYRIFKLKAYFKSNTNVKEQTDEKFFKKLTNKTLVPNKINRTLETFIEAIKNGAKDELKGTPNF